MKYSKQRQLVLESIRLLGNHPTADEVYAHVRREIPNISLGTVYRNLKCLEETGCIRRVPLTNGPDRFDHRLEDHFHLFCQQCGRVFDFFPAGTPGNSLTLSNPLREQIFQQTHFQAASWNMIIEGVCAQCVGELPRQV